MKIQDRDLTRKGVHRAVPEKSFVAIGESDVPLKKERGNDEGEREYGDRP